MSTLKNQSVKPLSDKRSAIVGVREASEGVAGKKNWWLTLGRISCKI